jgi:hypothetical protein
MNESWGVFKKTNDIILSPPFLLSYLNIFNCTYKMYYTDNSSDDIVVDENIYLLVSHIGLTMTSLPKTRKQR